MDEQKLFKDPIYGYIKIPNLLIKNVIDTPVFQRLRRIIQTSYAPLYATALHNRFTHSLGVYHLGRIAINAIIEKATETERDFLKKYQDVFLLACLLHDVGHAPFSHIGEVFYLKETDDYSEIHTLLRETVKDSKFSEDIPSLKSEFAAPHEIMSVIVGLKQFEKLCIDSENSIFSDSKNRSFFARCITGYVYKSSETEITTEMENLNCLISLLNSPLIDVDKLDYLMRDAYMLGFNSVTIDYMRLLSALQISTNDEGITELIFNKNAISVIENVVYARDAEKRWIQMHPAVLYEMYLLSSAMKQLKSCIIENSNPLFSYEALSQEGVSFKVQPFKDKKTGSNTHTTVKEYKIRLLSDDDIVYLLKNEFPNHYFDKFMDRNLRRHPLWKTEAEYKAFFLIEMRNSPCGKNFESAMNSLAKYMEHDGIYYIDQKLLEKIEEEITKINDLKDEDIDRRSKMTSIAEKRKIKAILDGLNSFSKENSIEFNYILIQKGQFVSSFDKDNFSKIKIAFSCGNEKPKIVDFGDVALSITAQKDESNKTDNSFYHLFYKRSDGNSFDIKKLERKWEDFLKDNK